MDPHDCHPTQIWVSVIFKRTACPKSGGIHVAAAVVSVRSVDGIDERLCVNRNVSLLFLATLFGA